MPYLGVLNALSITEQNAGDNVWNRVHVTENNTIVNIEFSDINPSSLYVELEVDSGVTGFSFGPENIEWIGGTFPGYNQGVIEIWKFFQNSTGVLFGTKIGTEGQIVSDIANNAVDTENIVDQAVTTDKIANGAVTNEELATNAVDTDNIVDGAITDDKLHSTAISLFASAAQGSLANTSIQPGDAFEAPLLHLQLIYASGTSGGSVTTGSWQVLPVNTKTQDDISSTLSSNTFTLPAGTYRIQAAQEFFACLGCRIKLYNVTDSLDILIGRTAYTRNDTTNSNYSSTAASLNGIFTLSGNKTLEMMYRTGATRASSGLGVATSFGDDEIYSDILIWKIA